MSNHRRFFVQPDQIKDKWVELDRPASTQIAKVLRLKPGDDIVVLDGSGIEMQASIQSVSYDAVRARILDSQPSAAEPVLKLTLGICLPKRDKMEMVVQKCTELGVSEILVAESERTIARPRREKVEGKLTRWEKIAAEAAEQSGRAAIPSVQGIIRYEELAAAADLFDLAVVAWEDEEAESLAKVLRKNANAASVLLIVGPEGGLTESEVRLAESHGAQCVTLGKRLLRTETAAIAACAAVMYEIEGEL